MKKVEIALVFIFVPLLFFGQMATIDAAANTQLKLMNMTEKSQGAILKQILVELKKMNRKLDDQSETLNRSLEIGEQELEAKVKPASYVVHSAEANQTRRLKDKVLRVFRETKRNVQNLKSLSGKEVSSFMLYHTDQLVMAQKCFSNAREIMLTTSLISSEERIKMLHGYNSQLETILDKMLEYNQKLSETSRLRLSKQSIMNLSKSGS